MSIRLVLQRTGRLSGGHTHRAGFCSTVRLREEAATRLKNTGALPAYGPVGVAKALEASPSTRTSPTPLRTIHDRHSIDDFVLRMP